MNETVKAVLSGLMAICWFALASRALTLNNFVGLAREAVSYWLVVGLFVIFGLGAGLQAAGV